MNYNSALSQRQKEALEDVWLLDIKPAAFSNAFEEFKNAHNLLHIKGCRREVLIGRSLSPENIPPHSTDDVSVFKGAEAYKHLLIYITGLISRIRGENQIVSQFKRAHGELRTRNHAAAESLNPLFHNIMRDNSLVRTHITRDLKPAFYEACAHELSGPRNQDTVLVVVDTDKNGTKPSEVTKNIIRYLGNKTKSAATTIIFTHPDEDVLNTVFNFFLRQKDKNRISSQIGKLPFNNAFDYLGDLQRFLRVFVCFPMGKNPKIDELMINTWGQKEALGGVLLHLGGRTKPDRKSIGAWENPELFNYVSPEEIVAWQEQRKSQNEQLIEDGKAACGICADLIINGERPNPQKILSKLQMT